MKVVINDCYGGFSLSALAVKRLAELQGKKCYFFKCPGLKDYIPITLDDAQNNGLSIAYWVAFSVDNPNEFLKEKPEWKNLSDIERNKAFNKIYNKIKIDNRPEDRADKFLVQVVEELGEKANGMCASLRIVEIPDGTDYEIGEYDGNEHIAEKHKCWR